MSRLGDKVMLRFFKDTKDHKLTIFQDDGKGRRHLRFCSKEWSRHSFDIITFPGHLLITGDMGSFLFKRLYDMFTFFREDDGEDQSLSINPAYWAEKLEAAEEPSGYQQFSPSKFKEQVRRYYVESCEDPDNLTKEEKKGWRDIVEDVFPRAEDGEYAARAALDDFPGNHFTDFWEVNCKEYTFLYLWCLWAIVWGIRQYDIYQQSQAEKESQV